MWYWFIYDGTGSAESGTGRYLMVLGQYNLVLLGFKWNWISTRLLCLYILKKVEIWLEVTIAGWTDDNKERKSYSANGPRTAEMSNISHKYLSSPQFLGNHILAR